MRPGSEQARERPPLDLVIGTFKRGDGIRTRSVREPSVIFVCAHSGQVALDGVVVRLHPAPRRLLVAMLALRGHLLAQDDAVELLWGDRADGGPLSGVYQVAVLVGQVRVAAAALGYRINTEYGRGWRAVRALRVGAAAA